MKYIKKFSESLLDDVRKKTDNVVSDIHNKLGKSSDKYCTQCGKKNEMSVSFCRECGEKFDVSSNDTNTNKKFTIEGKLVESDNPYGAKTPPLQISSMAKYIDGTKVIYGGGKIDIFDLINKQVTITGTTKDGEEPCFNNPIYCSSDDIVASK